MKDETENNLFTSIKLKEEIKFPKYAYIGHPITDIKEILGEEETALAIDFIESVGDLTKRFGYTPILPSIIGTYVKKSTTAKEQIYNDCALAVRISTLFIAIPIVPSIGLGMEIQLAISNKIPILLLVNKKTKLTSMINNHHGKVIWYNEYTDCLGYVHKHFTENNYVQNFSYYTFEKITA